MRRETIRLYEATEYQNKKGAFIPNLNAYLHEDNSKRPAIIVVPGGGYEFISSGEAYIIAMRYYKEGYQAYVLTYTVNTLGLLDPIGRQPLKDISRAVCEVRNRCECDSINSNQVAVVGFSAGGHLAASIAVHHDKNIKMPQDMDRNNRPDAVILSYPVISAREHRHEGSIKALYGVNPMEEQLHFASLDENITSNTPPTFLWHTVTDNVVPVENSLQFMKACKDSKVPVEMHIYPTGQHGLSAANEEWIRNEIGDSSYTYEQTREDIAYLMKNRLTEVPEDYQITEELTLDEFAETYYQIGKESRKKNKFYIPTYDSTVSDWMTRSIVFLDKVWMKLI